MTRILDSHALMIYLEKEPGHEKLESIFVSAVERDEHLLMTTVNYGEIYYIILRECGQEKVNEIESIIRTLPVEVIDVDITLAKEAARFKAAKKISYADCFAVATALREGAPLVTGDPEFKKVEKTIEIDWL